MAWARFDLLPGIGIPIAWNEHVGGGDPDFHQLELHQSVPAAHRQVATSRIDVNHPDMLPRLSLI
jgi:hypothetical protein